MQCLDILLTPESVQYGVGFFSTLRLFHGTVGKEKDDFLLEEAAKRGGNQLHKFEGANRRQEEVEENHQGKNGASTVASVKKLTKWRAVF